MISRNLIRKANKTISKIQAKKTGIQAKKITSRVGAKGVKKVGKSLKINSRIGKGKKIGKAPPTVNSPNQRGTLVITTDASGKRTISTGKTMKTSPPPRHAPPQQPQRQRTSNTLQIRNLNTKVTEADLHLSLNRYGDVERVVLIRRVDPRRDESVSTGVAEVVFKSSTSATRAKDELDGKMVDGQRISCRFMGEEPLSFVGRAQKAPLESHSLKNRKKGNMAMDID